MSVHDFAQSTSLLSWAFQRKTRRAVIAAAALVVSWELLGTFVITNKLFFAAPSSMLEAGVKLWASGALQQDIIASFTAIAYGMVLAIVIGIFIGILSGVSQTFLEYTDWFFTAMYSTPLVAVAPILILWFGIGIASKVVVVFLMAVFPILISTAAGIRNTDAAFIDVARSFGASRTQIVRKVQMPASIPFIATGIRLAIGRAVVGVVVGELFGAYAGLGFLVFTAGQTFDAPALFLGVFLLSVTGVGLTSLMKLVESRAAKWRHSDGEH
ncbi:MAG: ABC transporter permease [Burkholderiaceae bacterium]|nr:MAG: ABC transporter permease [Burkholderiaceae bacterium]